MASFAEELWNSIFTPGPTPTLLIATNASFAALQVVLLALLYYTYSIHFLILSVLCGGLWYSINWFATELLKEQEKQRKKEAESSDGLQSSTQPQVKSGSKTETNTKSQAPIDRKQESTIVSSPPSSSASSAQPATKRQTEVTSVPKPVFSKPTTTQQPTTTASTSGRDTSIVPETQETPTMLTPAKFGSYTDLRRRRPSLGDSSDYVSTDSEWEKVSETGDQ